MGYVGGWRWITYSAATGMADHQEQGWELVSKRFGAYRDSPRFRDMRVVGSGGACSETTVYEGAKCEAAPT